MYELIQIQKTIERREKQKDREGEAEKTGGVSDELNYEINKKKLRGL
jgi:hypothetical protein